MFRNAGSKLKILAKVFFWITVISGLLVGIILADGSDGLSLLIIPFAVIGGWLSTIMMYAFGELCENVKNISEKL